MVGRSTLGLARRAALAEAVLLVAMAAVSLWTFWGASLSVSFQGDESNYMTRGRYFLYLFVRHDLRNPLWNDNYQAHTQPMLANYIVGATLWLAGYDLDRVKGYDWRQPYKQNIEEGRVPNPATLALIRQPMVALSVGVVLLLYAIARLLAGPLAGLVAALSGLASPVAQSWLVRARNDSPLAFFMLLALLLGLLGARRGYRGSLPAGWALLTGLALGLAVAAKLTALCGLVATLAWAGLVALAAWCWSGPGLAARLSAAWIASRGWLLALLVALAVFVAANPHLWPDPLLHTAHLLQHRTSQMLSHQRSVPRSAVVELKDRPGRVLVRSTIDTTRTGSAGVPLEALIMAVGALALALRAWQSCSRRALPADEGLLLTTALAYFAGVSAGLYVSFALYFIPTFLLAAVIGGVGASLILRLLGRAIARVLHIRRGAAPHSSALAPG